MGVILTGYIDVPEDRRTAIDAALPEHVRLTRAEPGCLRFDVVPDQNQPGRFLVSEEFVDRPAFEAHQARVRSSNWGKISEGIPRQYEIVEQDS